MPPSSGTSGLPETDGSTRLVVGLGLVSLAFYALHAGHYFLFRTDVSSVLWACTMASALIGVGLIARRPRPVAIGILWLAVGIPAWLLDLAAGGELLLTSILTHVGAPAAGLAGLRRLGGLPRHSWLAAALALGALHALCRFVTVPAENVNLAHAIWPGWEHLFPSHDVYVVSLVALCTAIFAAVEAALRRLGFGAAAVVDFGQTAR
jgi:hypothetical protein